MDISKIIYETESGFRCKIKGVVYRNNNKSPAWCAVIARKDVNLTSSYSIKKYGFENALFRAVKDIKRWKLSYPDTDEYFTTEERKKIMAFGLPISDEINKKMKRKKKPNTRVIIDQKMINNAKQDFFKRGGVITKIS